MARRAIFVLDPLPGRYEGWTIGLDWNGFACPLFTEEVARLIVRDLNACGEASAVLDEGSGVISVEDDDYPGEPERFEPELVALDGREVRLWAVGAMAWAWWEERPPGSAESI
jgi:hypothetical protein